MKITRYQILSEKKGFQSSHFKGSHQKILTNIVETFHETSLLGLFKAQPNQNPKSKIQNRLTTIATGTALAFPIVLLISLPTRAIDIPQPVTNGLFRSSSEDFFREGRRQFEREVQILQDRRLSSENPILNTDDVRTQEQLSPLEMRNNSPGSFARPGMKKYRNFVRGRR